MRAAAHSVSDSFSCKVLSVSSVMVFPFSLAKRPRSWLPRDLPAEERPSAERRTQLSTLTARGHVSFIHAMLAGTTDIFRVLPDPPSRIAPPGQQRNRSVDQKDPQHYPCASTITETNWERAHLGRRGRIIGSPSRAPHSHTAARVTSGRVTKLLDPWGRRGEPTART